MSQFGQVKGSSIQALSKFRKTSFGACYTENTRPAYKIKNSQICTNH